MMLPPSRRLYAVPQTWQARLEIAKAIRTLALENDDEQLRQRAAGEAIRSDSELIAEIDREVCRDLCKAGFNPNEPRWPKGSGEIGGGWSGGSGAAQTDAVDDRQAQNPTLSSNADHIRADEIPAESSRHPVPFVDGADKPVLDDQGNPLQRPAHLPPEMFVQAGLEFKDAFSGLTRVGGIGLALTALGAELSQFGQNGPWDAERFQGKYVDDYSDYATIAIGLYMAAAGVPFQLALLIQNIYAIGHSTHGEPTDW